MAPSKIMVYGSTSRVKIHNTLSDPFPVNCGVKQGSKLSLTLFLVVMNSLLEKIRSAKTGASLHGTFVGTTVHADDIRSIAPNGYTIESFLVHLCINHPQLVCNESPTSHIEKLSSVDMPFIITLRLNLFHIT